MEKEVFSKLESIAVYNASNYFRDHRELFLRDAVDMPDLVQEALIAAHSAYKAGMEKKKNKKFDIYKYVALRVGGHMNNKLRGAIAHSKKILQYSDTDIENMEDLESAPDFKVCEPHTTVEEFYDTLSSSFFDDVNVDEYLSLFKGRDYKIAFKRIVQDKTFETIAKELKMYKRGGAMRICEIWNNTIVPELKSHYLEQNS
jgi:hypothetical protein